MPELGEFAEDGLSHRGVAPDADAVIGRRLPGGFEFRADHDRVPADLQLETGGGHAVERQLPVVGVLTDRPLHPEPERGDSLESGEHIVQRRGLNVDVLHRGSNRIDLHTAHVGDGDRVVSLVDPQEPDLHLQAGHVLVDVVRQPRVEDGLVVAAHRLRFARDHRHMPESGLTRHPAGADHSHRLRSGNRRCEDFLCDAFRAGEAPQPLHAPQGRFLGCRLDDRDPALGDPRDDAVEGFVIVDLPAQRDDVLGRAPPDQEPAGAIVEAKTHGIAVEIVDVQPDRIGTETPPIGQPIRLHDNVSQVHRTEHRIIGARAEELAHRSASRKAVARVLNRSARSHCTQWPTLAARYRSQLGMTSASMRAPAGRLTLSPVPHTTSVG